MNIKKNIPNALTCMNLLCGCVGIIIALGEDHKLFYASYLIGLAALFDFLDGFVARLLNVHSEIGKQLDSLADMVTFGALPGFIMFELIKGAYENAQQDGHHLQYISLLIPVFSAIRLAKFNIDTRQSDSFIGVPTPANAILIGSFPLIIVQVFSWSMSPMETLVLKILVHPSFLIAVTVIMSYLLVAELPLFALKFKNFSWAENKIRYLFLGLSLVSLITLHFVAIPLIIVLYILLSLISKSIKRTS